MKPFSMVNRVFSVQTRLLLSFLLLSFPFFAGMAAASPWYIAWCAPVFVMADILGKWRLSFRGKAYGYVAKFAAQGLLVQAIVVGLIYLLGRGLGSLLEYPRFLAFGEGINVLMWAGYAAITFILGLLLLMIERGKTDMAGAVQTELGTMTTHPSADENWPGLTAPAVRVTLETLFDGHHYSHYDRSEDGERTLNATKAYVSEQHVAECEASLDVAFPPLLRSLYLHQNGGSIRNLYVGDADNPKEQDPSPFSGYEELIPLERIRSLHDAVCDYAAEDQLDMFPRDAKGMVILAQWYRETLFLDYRDGRTTPRVGFYDFDNSDDLQSDAWEDDAVFWPDFDSFFDGFYKQDRYG